MLTMDRIRQVFPPLIRRRTPPVKKVFGASLEDVNYSIITPNHEHQLLPVPFVVHRICTYLYQSGGIGSEGLFRVNGNSKVVDTYKLSFERTGDANFESDDDYMAAASCLKNYLRDLSDSLIPEHFNGDFLAIQADLRQPNEDVICKLCAILEKLPVRNHDLLKYLMRFLVDVAANESNRMTARGLAIVFGPNIFRPGSDLGGLRDQGVFNDITTLLVEEYSQIFGPVDEPGPYTQLLAYVPFNKKPKEKDKSGDKNKNNAPNNHAQPIVKQGRQPPARPPPPKFSDSVPCIVHPDVSDDTRPITAASSEFERGSPFTMTDADGHSSMASPVLSAVASELVTKTISEAVLEHIFQVDETESRRIFGNWGDGDYDSDTQSELHLVNGHDSPIKFTDGPRPSTSQTIIGASKEQVPKPRPRTSRQDSKEEDGNVSPSKPTPKPRTKSAPIRRQDMALHESITMPLVNGNSHHSDSLNLDSTSTMHTSDLQPIRNNADPDSKQVKVIQEPSELNLDLLSTNTAPLTHYDRPKGPANRKPRSRSLFGSQEFNKPVKGEVKFTHQPTIEILDLNNNNGSEITNGAAQSASRPNSNKRRSPAKDELDATVTDSSAEHLITAQTSFEDTSQISDTRAKSTQSSTTAKGTEQLEPREPEDKGTTPSADHPSPPVAEAASIEPPATPVKTADEESRAANIKSLSRKINGFKKKIKAFEDRFEADHGIKPTVQDKNAKIEIKKAMAELSKARKELKALKEQDRVESAEPSDGHNKSKTKDSQRPDSIALQPNTSEPPTMGETLDVLLRRLNEKRIEAKRSDDLHALTRDQVQEEKVAVQKALLHFESLHGRPQTKSEKELMRPLYDRYRQIKKVLASVPASDPSGASKATEETTAQPEQLGGQPTIAVPDEDSGDSPSGNDNKNHLQELSVQELKEELEKVNNEKKRLRKILRDFEDDFSQRHGRKVQREDRGPMSKEYSEYKQVKAKIKLLEALLMKEG